MMANSGFNNGISSALLWFLGLGQVFLKISEDVTFVYLKDQRVGKIVYNLKKNIYKNFKIFLLPPEPIFSVCLFTINVKESFALI